MPLCSESHKPCLRSATAPHLAALLVLGLFLKCYHMLIPETGWNCGLGRKIVKPHAIRLSGTNMGTEVAEHTTAAPFCCEAGNAQVVL